MDKKEEKRTLTQNDSIHLWLDQVASALNDAGFDVKAVVRLFREEGEIPFTKENVKELLWRPAQKAMFGKKSTTELNKLKEIDLICKVVNKFLSEKCHLEYIPFPSLESLIK